MTPYSLHEGLLKRLEERFPDSTPSAREHVVALSAAFDTASGFALSFGIKKFQTLANSYFLSYTYGVTDF